MNGKGLSFKGDALGRPSLAGSSSGLRGGGSAPWRFYRITPFPAVKWDIQKPWVQKRVPVCRSQEMLACSVLRSLDVKRSKMVVVAVITAVIVIAEIQSVVVGQALD